MALQLFGTAPAPHIVRHDFA